MMGITGIDARFFCHIWDDESGLDVVECDESTFLDLVSKGHPIHYERHNVFDNGCRQICLTTEGTIGKS